jgi:pyruvate kinase
MSERAEGVMLNKGPYVCDADRSLDDILCRMQAHQLKKRAVLRPLDVARQLLSELTVRVDEQTPQGFDVQSTATVCSDGDGPVGAR